MKTLSLAVRNHLCRLLPIAHDEWRGPGFDRLVQIAAGSWHLGRHVLAEDRPSDVSSDWRAQASLEAGEAIAYAGLALSSPLLSVEEINGAISSAVGRYESALSADQSARVCYDDLADPAGARAEDAAYVKAEAASFETALRAMAARAAA